MKSPATVRGFTLVELLISMGILAFILVILFNITNSISQTWAYTNAKTEQFREARGAFDSMTRRIAQATLNTYWDYERDATGAPKRYVRQSELRFLSGPTATITGSISSERPGHGIFFQAPLGFVDEPQLANFNNLLNTWGYFLEFGSDRDTRPDFITDAITQPRYRFRLMELMEPSEDLTIYKQTSGKDSDGLPKNLSYTGRDWITTPLGKTPRPVRILAENIIALVILPKLPAEEDPTGTALAPDYLYDSSVSRAPAKTNPKNQLPPAVQVTMVSIDEVSAARLAQRFGSSPPDFGLDALFVDADKYKQDLMAGSTTSLEQRLIDERINYRIFTATVGLRGAKWSSNQ